jgi:hypothetical protein
MSCDEPVEVPPALAVSRSDYEELVVRASISLCAAIVNHRQRETLTVAENIRCPQEAQCEINSRGP